MSANNGRQFEPLRRPSHWNAEEKRLIQQIEDILDELHYRVYGRLELDDMDPAFQNRIEESEDAISEVRQTAQGLESRVADAEGAASQALQTAQGLQIQVTNLAGDIASLSIAATGIMAAVNNNRLSFSAAGLRLINASGQVVFDQSMSTGNLNLSGSINATGGSIGGLTISPTGLSYGNLYISVGGDYPMLHIGDLLISGNPNAGMTYGDPEAPILGVNYRGVYVGRWA